jgi:hypothetical protein
VGGQRDLVPRVHQSSGDGRIGLNISARAHRQDGDTQGVGKRAGNGLLPLETEELARHREYGGPHERARERSEKDIHKRSDCRVTIWGNSASLPRDGTDFFTETPEHVTGCAEKS